MMASMQHLHPSAQEVASWPNEQRLAWLLHDRWFNYPRADQILKRLSEILRLPPRGRMPCVLIYGAPGMGKTKLNEKFARDNQPKFDSSTGMTERPFVSMQLPPEPLERDFYDELL